MIFKRHKVVKYISRKKAAELLDISIKDFHELTILTHTKPISPKNSQKHDHEDILFYKITDIQKIIDNDTFNTLRTQKWITKKRSEHISNSNFLKAEKLFNVEHNYIKLISERYQTFKDAIVGLSDSLSTLYTIIYLFPSLIIYDDLNVIINEFKLYVKNRKILKNVFISKKGFYFLVEVNNIQVIWLEPFFIENGLDIKDFKIDDINVLYKFAYYHLKLCMKSLCEQNLEKKMDDSLYENKRFYLHTFNQQLSYIIEYLGGKVLEKMEDFDFYITDYDITDFDARNIYLQPQYVFDCFNKGVILPYDEYIVGKTLPKHKCPFSKNESFQIDNRMFALMSKTKQRLISEYIKDTKY